MKTKKESRICIKVERDRMKLSNTRTFESDTSRHALEQIVASMQNTVQGETSNLLWLASMSLKTWMDWLALFLPYLGNHFCFWFSPSRQLSHMKTSFQLRRRRPQSIILIFSLWSTAPPSSARRMGTTAPVLWSLFAQNRRQLSAIIVRKLPAQICNYWPLIVIKFTSNAQRLTPFDKKLASLSFYFRNMPRSSECHLFHVEKTTGSIYVYTL